jgi:hypothetical protein
VEPSSSKADCHFSSSSSWGSSDSASSSSSGSRVTPAIARLATCTSVFGAIRTVTWSSSSREIVP